MNKLLFFCIIIFSSFYAFAQDQSCNCQYYNVDDEVMSEKLLGKALKQDDYIYPKNDAFGMASIGEIELNSGEIVNNKIIRYDGLTDQLILSGKEKIAVDKETIKGFYLNQVKTASKLRFTKIKRSYTNDIFMQVLVDDSIKLYVYRKLIRKASSNELSTSYTYYIEKQSKTFYPMFQISKRSLLDCFPEKQDIVKSALRKNAVKIKTEDDLIKAVKLINDL